MRYFAWHTQAEFQESLKTAHLKEHLGTILINLGPKGLKRDTFSPKLSGFCKYFRKVHEHSEEFYAKLKIIYAYMSAASAKYLMAELKANYISWHLYPKLLDLVGFNQVTALNCVLFIQVDDLQRMKICCWLVAETFKLLNF